MCSFLIYQGTYDKKIIKKALHKLKLRGPDLVRHFTYAGYTFVHCLLHITGKLTGQPFFDSSNQIICLFNGEIYNYKSFGSEYGSDGECLIPLYLKYGHSF